MYVTDVHDQAHIRVSVDRPGQQRCIVEKQLRIGPIAEHGNRDRRRVFAVREEPDRYVGQGRGRGHCSAEKCSCDQRILHAVFSFRWVGCAVLVMLGTAYCGLMNLAIGEAGRAAAARHLAVVLRSNPVDRPIAAVHAPRASCPHWRNGPTAPANQ
jgi:hypothetical protein